MGESDTRFSMGEKFSSLEELKLKLDKYKHHTWTEFWKRDCRTLENQRKRNPDTVKNANVNVKYYYIRFACIKGGREYEPKNEASTRKRTCKQDCPAGFFIHLSECQQFLECREINENHNHITSKSLSTIEPQRELKVPTKTKKRSKKASLRSKIKVEADLSSDEKFRLMDNECRKLSKLCSEVPTEIFHRRLAMIQTLTQLWTNSNDNIKSPKIENRTDEEVINLLFLEENQIMLKDEIVNGEIDQGIMANNKKARPKGGGGVLVKKRRKKNSGVD